MGPIIKKIAALYNTAALVFMNSVVLFLLGIFVLFVANQTGKMVDNARNNSPISKVIDIAKLENAYPRLNKSDINRLLSETWRERFLVYESFTQFREHNFKGRYVNIDKKGFRISKNQGPWPPASSSYNVFIFGGGTVFGYGISDDKTIASCLQKILSEETGRHINVYNFGRCFYYSTQERMLFEKLLISGNSPDLAIFIDGINDFANINDLPLFSSALKQNIGEGNLVSYNIQSRLEILQMSLDALPLIKHNKIDLLKKYNLVSLLEHLKTIKLSDIYSQEALNMIISNIINRYLENKRIIEAVSDKAGVNPVFVWQPIPFHNSEPGLDQPDIERILSLHLSKQGYPRMKKVIKDKNISWKNSFLWCADFQEKQNDLLNQTSLNYSEKLLETLANVIKDFILSRKFIDKTANNG